MPFNKNANIAARASLAAHAQGKFWEYHDLLFENQHELEKPALEKYAKQLKLDVRKFKVARLRAKRLKTLYRLILSLDSGSVLGTVPWYL